VKGGADVINLSMSTPDRTPDVLRAAIDEAAKRGVLVVASAGNGGRPTADFPGRWAFAVGSTDNADRRAPFSNYGDHVDLAAPGVDVYSLYVSHNQAATATWSGTSFSAALTSGAAAVVEDRYNERGDDVRKRLLRAADSLASSAGFKARLDLASAVGIR
jgi:thermitase